MPVLKAPAVISPRNRETITDTQAGFAGGANPLGATGLVPLDQVAAMSNMRLVRTQELAKRPGLRNLGSLTVASRLYGMVTASGPVMIAIENTGAAYTRRTVAFAWNNAGTLTLTVTALAAGGTTIFTGPKAAQFRDGTGDVLYIPAYDPANKYAMSKWDGVTTVTDGVRTAVGAVICVWVYNQRLFACSGGTPVGSGSGPTSQTLYYSGLNNGDTLGDTANGGGSATIRTYGGQNIVGGFAVGNSNYILHQNAISVFRGTTFDDINITAGTEGVTPNIGLPADWCVVDQTGYVLTSQGLYIVTDGGVRRAGTPEYPDPINTLLQSQTSATSAVAGEQPWYVLDNTKRKEIWCIVTIRTLAGVATSYGFIYHTELGRFTGQCQFGVVIAHAFAGFANASIGEPQMYFISGTSLYTCDFSRTNMDEYQDNSVSYTSSVQMRRMFSQQAPADQKAFRYAYVQMGSGAGNAPVTTGSSTGASLSYTNATGTVADTTNMKAQQVNAIQLAGQGPYLDMTVSDGGASSTGWSILRAEIEGASYGRRGG